MQLNCLKFKGMLRGEYNVTESYRYCYKIVTSIEKPVYSTYNGIMSRLQSNRSDSKENLDVRN